MTRLPVADKLAFDAAWERMVSDPGPAHELVADVLWRLTVLQAKFLEWENERRVARARRWPKFAAVICLLVLAPLCGCAGWTRHDSYRQAAYTAALTIDTLQTVKIARSDGRYYEANPVAAAVIGKHPSTDGVIVGAVALYAASTALFIALPPDYRPLVQYLFIGAHAAAVGNNLAIGIGWGF